MASYFTEPQWLILTGRSHPSRHAILQTMIRTSGVSDLVQGTRVRFESSAPFTPVYVQHQLAPSKHSSSEYYENRIKNRTLNLERTALRDARRTQLAAERTARRAKDAQRRAATVHSRTKLPDIKGMWTLNPEEARWDVFAPLHALWLGYMAELLNLPPRPTSVGETNHAKKMPNTVDMQAKLVKADFHGCIVQVRRAKNPFLVGRAGIIVHETENTFKVVTRKDKFKSMHICNALWPLAFPPACYADLRADETNDHGAVIPKRHSVFVFRIPLYGPARSDATTSTSASTAADEPEIEFELYGNQFCYRPADRASRKFKHKETIELE